MKTGIGKLLQIDTGNRLMILALLVQAGCTGIFIGTLELAGNVMFLDSLEDGNQLRLASAMMFSGAAGILVASIYSYFSKQLKARSFGIVNLVAAVVIAVVLQTASGMLDSSEFSFVLFVLMGPLLLIILLGFWITVRGFLSPSSGKQLSGLVEMTLVGGMALAFTGIPFLVRIELKLTEILSVGLGSLVLAAVAQLYVLAGMRRNRAFPSRRVSSSGPFRLFSHRYTGLISAFVAIGVMVSVALHFSFLSSLSDEHVGDVDMVAFLGFFFGAMMVVGWMMKRALFGWIKKRFGTGVTLLMLPLLLLVVLLASIITWDAYGLDAGFHIIPYFFLSVFMARFIFGAWQTSMQDPSLNVIYQSLDPREKQNIKSGIEGVLSQIGVFAIGLVLVLFASVNILAEGSTIRQAIIPVYYLLVALVMAWFFVGLSLYRSYRKILRISLESDRIRDRQDLGLKELAKTDLQKTAFPVESIEFNPYIFHYKPGDDLLAMLDHSHPGVRIRVWDHLLGSSPGLPQKTLSRMLASEHEPAIRERIRKLERRKLRSKLGLQEAFIKERIDRFSDDVTPVDPAVDEAFQSGVRNEVLAALYHVAREHDRTHLQEVVSLLKDKDLGVRSVAISTAGKMDSRRVASSLIESLEHPDLYTLGWSALVSQGGAVLEDLEAAFLKPGSDIKLQKRIVSVFAAIGGERAMQLLVEKLGYHHREVFDAVVLGLYENRFHATELQTATIQTAILRLVHTGAWNLAAKVAVRMDNPGGSVRVAIDHEIWDVNEMILRLLALVYDRRSVHRIRMNLLDKQTEDRGIAIELLDLLLTEPLKRVLISYFTDVLIREKVDSLQAPYRIDPIPVKLLLRKILNRDGMQMGDFIRVCVLERMGNVTAFFDEQQIIAQGFHPNPKIRETAAQLFRKNDPGRYDMVTERLDFPDNSFSDHEDSATWYVNTTINLAVWKLFKNVGINSLFKLVSLLQPFRDELCSAGDFVVLTRSAPVAGISPLSNGIAIIAAHQPEIVEQISYLVADDKADAYLIERKEFVELLFDDRSLLHLFNAFLNQVGDRLA
ncbi:MAG: HEAT repeat domain-containing protein [Bacteroidota bacterium]